MLPSGAFDHSGSSEEDAELEDAVCHGKFSSREKLSREISFESDDGLSPDNYALFLNLLTEADRLSNNTGSHVKIQKLTTSKSTPYKTILRRTK